VKSESDTPLNLQSRLSLRPKEAAEALGISERTLRQMLPELPHVRAGGAILLPVDTLREWLRDQARFDRGRVDGVVNEVLDSLGKSTKDTP
jgi:excisionase family DNA binding protein